MTKETLELGIKKHTFGYKLWGCNLIMGTLLLYYISCKVTTIDTTNLWHLFFVLLVLCLFMIYANLQDIRHNAYCILRIIDREKFEKKIEVANNKFYKIFDNMCCDNRDLKSKIPCRELLNIIIPSKTINKWERHIDNNKIIGYWPGGQSSYIIECPSKIRNALIKLQNNL